MNELYKESSPYLLQHANNPVHWKSWSEKSLQFAKQENKLLLVSIGYSTCHWCHVMEHESFENQEVARVMNEHFVNIKVDREERPDVDAIYMTALQIMTGRGGWPLNVVCLPDGRPVWGGTYFSPREWMDTLSQLQNLFQDQPEKLIEYAGKLTEGIAFLQIRSTSKNDENKKFLLEDLISKWKKSFDWDYGGMARSPKFMMPNNYQFLLRYAFENNNQPILDFVHLTLTKMAQGGIFDVIQGGFSRYAVDMKWHIPHFEKMLYDNAQLLSLYSEAYKLTKNPLYEEVIRKIVKFLEEEFLTPEGCFYSALDADSLNAKGKLEEGAFYVWTKSELQEVLGEDFQLFAQVFNISEFGYWEHDNYVLIQKQTLDKIAEQNHISLSELKFKKTIWESLLLQNRNLRSKPRLDDKILTSWNSLAIKGLIDAYNALGEERYLALAVKNADFIQNNLLDQSGFLYRKFSNNQSSINAFLEDYAFVIQAYLSLYKTTGSAQWVIEAKQLMDYCLDNFYQESQVFFTFKSQQDNPLISIYFEIEDNVIPSSNSVMAQNLFELGIIFNNIYYQNISKKMLNIILSNIDYPSAFSQWLNLYLTTSAQFLEITITGKNAVSYLKDFNQRYLPNAMIIASEKINNIPHFQDKIFDDETQFYICKNKMCWPPVKDIDSVFDLIGS